VRRPAVLILAVSTALTMGLGACALLAAPVGAATGPLDKVTVSTDTSTKPTVKFDKPFAVKKTVDSVVTAGTGAALTTGQTITFDFVLVDGRTGKQVQTSYGATPGSLVLDSTKTTKQIVDSLTGQPIGSRVLVAFAPKDGLAKNLAAQTAQAKSKPVKKNDTLLFVIDVKNVRTPLARATGDAVAPVDGLPTVALADNGKPTITVPSGVAAPTTLVVQPLIKGTGPVVQAGQTIGVNYTGVIWDTGKQFDSSWDKGQLFDFPLGKGAVIPGWDKALVGQTIGSQVLLVVPPAEGYGASGTSDGTIKGTDTLVFVVDILDVY
jgi:peptidylprolyl isomerase